MLLKMFQVTVTFLFYLSDIKNEGAMAQKPLFYSID